MIVLGGLGLINRPEDGATGSDERYETKGVTVDFAGLRALDRVDLSLTRREIVGLIGPNGAGKTTLLNVMTGVQATVEGDVYLDEQRITDWTPERIAHRGVGRTFQGVRIFPDLTVLENVEVGAVGVGVSPREARQRAAELVEWVHLADRAYLPARSLPAGDERRLGIDSNPYSFVLSVNNLRGPDDLEIFDGMASTFKIH